MSNHHSLLLSILLIISASFCCGCFQLKPQPMPGEIPLDYGPLQNPLVVPMLPRALVMDEISNELDNYFRIVREERVRLVDGVLTEGWIETEPKIVATLLEPWRKDSAAGFERLHASLQTVRRFAKVRIIPASNSYSVDLQIYKELEDLPQPQAANVSGIYVRHDNTMDIDDLPEQFQPTERGWIPMGRDVALENLILKNIQTRLQTAAGAQAGGKH